MVGIQHFKAHSLICIDFKIKQLTSKRTTTALFNFTLWEMLRFSTVFQLANITKITLYSPIKRKKRRKQAPGFACFLPTNRNLFSLCFFYSIALELSMGSASMVWLFW